MLFRSYAGVVVVAAWMWACERRVASWLAWVVAMLCLGHLVSLVYLFVRAARARSLAQVFVRKLVATESTATIVFWFSVTASALSTITIFWGWVIPAPREAIFLIIAGLLGGVGQILLTSSYRLADASVIAPFEYTSMLLAIGVGFFVFGEAPTKVMLIGAAIIISAGMIIILREHYLGLERAKQRKAMTPSG